jgi:signal transduction histidine kinase
MLFPLLIFSDRLVGLNVEIGVMDNFMYLIMATRFEIVTSTLVLSLYSIQFEARNELEKHKNNLEVLVEARTTELGDANDELRRINEILKSNNEEIKMLNENLDDLVKERSKKIEQQLRQLKNYANMNSHQVRAPLARILGLLSLLKMDQDEAYKQLHLSKLCESSEELDEVIRKMNRLLETEVN